MSHPVWVRGLKLSNHVANGAIEEVAPRVGAWIETFDRRIVNKRGKVAPRVGAWIETTKKAFRLDLAMSHPVWVRGLKHIVAKVYVLIYTSHPVWVRGLKLQSCCLLFA